MLFVLYELDGLWYLLHFEKQNSLLFVLCNTTTTVKHIFIECADLVEVRKKDSEVWSLYLLYWNVNPEKIFTSW